MTATDVRAWMEMLLGMAEARVADARWATFRDRMGDLFPEDEDH
jgi:hypothetical protein